MPLFSVFPALAYVVLFWQASRWLAQGCSQYLSRAYTVNCSILYTKTPHLFQRLFFRFFPPGKNACPAPVVSCCALVRGNPAAQSRVPGGHIATAKGAHGAVPCVHHVLLCTALLAVPAGSLPALWAWPLAGGALLGILLWTAAVLPGSVGGGPAPGVLPRLAARPLLLAGVGVGLAWGVLGLCGWHRGLPGSFWHLDAFVAHPLWLEVSLPGKVSVAMALLGLCSLLPGWPRQEDQTYDQPLSIAVVAWLMLWHAVVVTLFVPGTFGHWLAGNWWIVADFVLFWGKVGVLLFFVSPWCVRWLGPWAGACLLVAGLGGTLLWGLG